MEPRIRVRNRSPGSYMTDSTVCGLIEMVLSTQISAHDKILDFCRNQGGFREICVKKHAFSRIFEK